MFYKSALHETVVEWETTLQNDGERIKFYIS